jgi:predicted nuclease of predicted toxin-antitoxin system
VKFLIDNNLSPQVAVLLGEAGHEAVHIRDYGMQSAPDDEVLDRARVERRVLISADTDFGMLLSRQHAVTPSVILVRRIIGRRAKDIVDIVLANLDVVSDDIESGAIVVLGEDFVRVRPLPI